MKSEKFTGKTALITGGTSGLGRAMAEGFAADGASVYFIGRNRETGREVESAIAASGGRAAFIACDVTSPADISAAVKAAEAETGHIDILVNNAGVSSSGSVVSIELSEWQRVMDINLNAPFLFMRAALPAMQAHGGGSIINVSSLASKVTIPEAAGYCATKAALLHLSKQVALDFGKDGIRCNVIVPGLFETGINANDFAELGAGAGVSAREFMNAAYADSPLGKPAVPEQIYGLARFLASGDSSYVTGAEVIIDGGMSVVDPFVIGMEKAKLTYAQ
ncbi:MAG: SDR family oxidoreductase [Clostridiales Family XIII bacterium]|jgi:NAD(P)-dependent dehydrogenase (short-subunit alcohol dehydrogenase family)|nr:SDR family oxidoreductase [Clostridiales Family XIII bacterium]